MGGIPKCRKTIWSGPIDPYDIFTADQRDMHAQTGAFFQLWFDPAPRSTRVVKAPPRQNAAKKPLTGAPWPRKADLLGLPFIGMTAQVALKYGGSSAVPTDMQNRFHRTKTFRSGKKGCRIDGIVMPCILRCAPCRPVNIEFA